VLKLLQRKRYIVLVQDVAEALLAHGLDTVALRHRYALALVDNDRTAAAEALLRALPPEARSTDTEVQGAIGRVHKQRYVTSGPAAGPGRADDLVAAVDAYCAAYRDDPPGNYYHGVNVAALLHRASIRRLRHRPAGRPQPAGPPASHEEDVPDAGHGPPGTRLCRRAPPRNPRGAAVPP
jgi:hypothetical protein